MNRSAQDQNPYASPRTADSSQVFDGQTPWAVVLHNDDKNGFEHVVRVLREVFNYGFLRALCLTLRTHFRGESKVWEGSFEDAELKVNQLRSLGPDPKARSRGATILEVTIERLPN